jgi:hypothetical protein
MGFVKITKIDADGVSTKDLSELNDSERLDLELDVYFNAPIQMLCTACGIEIPKGTGFQCDKHKRKV